MSHATNMHGLVNTKRVWMGQRESAAQQQGNKKSILMNVPTRQCLRKRKRDKTEPSLQEHKVLARKQKNGSIAERHKTEVEFHHSFLDWQPRAFARGCKPQTAHYLCCRRFAAIDPNRRRLVGSPSRVLKTRATSRHGSHSLLLLIL